MPAVALQYGSTRMTDFHRASLKSPSAFYGIVRQCVTSTRQTSTWGRLPICRRSGRLATCPTFPKGTGRIRRNVKTLLRLRRPDRQAIAATRCPLAQKLALNFAPVSGIKCAHVYTKRSQRGDGRFLHHRAMTRCSHAQRNRRWNLFEENTLEREHFAPRR